MKQSLIISGQIILIVVLAEAFYWLTADWVRFNESTLDTPLEFIYYLAPGLFLIFLTATTTIYFYRLPPFLANLLMVLIATYGYICMIMIQSTYCEPNKNLNLFYTIVIALILAATAFLIIKRILPKMSIKNITFTFIAYLLTFFDFLYLLIGYHIFYPGNW